MAHTGGFGEPTCRACHFAFPLNAPGGRLEIRGLDGASGDRGKPVEVTVELVRSGLRRAGVELSVRYASGPSRGMQAGRFEVEGSRLERAEGPSGADDPVIFLRHTGAGSTLTAPDTARWRFRWLPPRSLEGSVVLHVAANAANDDASEFGDRIYADSVVFGAPARPSTGSAPDGSGFGPPGTAPGGR